MARVNTWWEDKSDRRRRMGCAMLVFMAVALWPSTTLAQGEAPVAFMLPALPLSDALKIIAQRTGENILYMPDVVAGLSAPALQGRMSARQAVVMLLKDTRLEVVSDGNGGLLIQVAAAPVATPATDPLPAIEQIVVTGSRIANSFPQTPTPGASLSNDQLTSLSPQSIPAGLAKLPVFAPARGSDSASDGGYQATGNYLDIYGLGAIRTLVLMDGHRVTSTYFDGTVDINTLPQMLVQRVEVVTSGASAVYGSDAVSGVANFILDKRFTGLKGVFQGGVSTYGDAKSFRAGLAGGTQLAQRLHFEGSVEFFNRDIIPTDPRPYGLDASSLVGSGLPGSPLQSVTNTRLSGAPFGGLVTSGPLAGRQFAPDGALVAFNPGTPTSTNGVAVGGDGGYKRPSFVLPSLQTAQAFGRLDYDVNDTIAGYLQVGYSHTRTWSHEQNLVSTAGSNALTIYSGNPYLKPAYQAQLDGSGTSSFGLARYNEDFGGLLSLTDRTSTASIAMGLQGTVFGNYDWEAYYTHGEGRVEQITRDNTNTERMYAAIDAVTDPRTGNIVCRVSITAPGAFSGCVPMNILGNGAPSQAAIAYVNGETRWKSINTLDDFGANITGTLFRNWAGPVKIAAGVEYRLQSLVETSSVADNTFNIQNLRVGPDGNTAPTGALKWTKNITAPMHGANSVHESDIELDVPLLKNLPLVRLLSVNGAARYTYYSSSGQAETWRLGLDWQVVDDLHLRATRSRDIRAPTLYDLYQGQSGNISGLVDFLTSTGGSVVNIMGGNPNLMPEVAHNTTMGLVYQPGWLKNFSASVDYYHAVINNAIATINGSAPQTQQICIASSGNSPLCNLVVRPFPITNTTPANYPTLNYNVKQNVALIYAEGVDVAINYEADLQRLDDGMNGILNLRLLWSHEPTLKNQTLPGTAIINVAGTAQTPKDRVALTADYLRGRFGASLIQRYYGSIHLSGNPALVAAQSIPAYWQTDINLNYDLDTPGQPVTGFLNINNLFNQFGGNCCAFTNNPGMQYPVASFTDRVGRYFVLGVRFKAN
jgi:outer membrane receptor protein involved in Fe transport